MNYDAQPFNVERVTQITSDACELSRCNESLPKLEYDQNNYIKVNRTFWKVLECATEKNIDKTLSHESGADRRNRKQFGPAKQPTFECDECHKMFPTNAALQTHRTKTHKVVHPLRSLVTTNICPLCKSSFTRCTVTYPTNFCKKIYRRRNPAYYQYK